MSRKSRRAKGPTLPHPMEVTDVGTLAHERLERLLLIESLIGAAMRQVFFLGFGDPWHWPAQVRRFDGSRVNRPEDVVDTAADLVASLGAPFRREICQLMGQPRDTVNETYRVLEPVSRDELEPEDESHRVERPRRSKDVSVPAGRTASSAGATHAPSRG